MAHIIIPDEAFDFIGKNLAINTNPTKIVRSALLYYLESGASGEKKMMLIGQSDSHDVFFKHLKEIVKN